ncbi:hypothetical protein QQY24_33745 [Streptomyces sp. TG1A-8]|uniref:hypothetical protein n=1 Tax=Streptomyces sp. TG1A-8 TaxID=3051385 RepID=UPI00265C5EE2|nr:hypothetical protein [Streptomyces sp. TG1A-8]MDO0930038.1 hypothetical protein [Streptomyces sp. TG1A-8]
MNEWNEDQHAAWHAAWKAWVDDVCSVEEAITVFAFEHGRQIRQVDADVKAVACRPGPTA